MVIIVVMCEAIECVITGRVQLVMFRDFVQRKAHSLKLAGTVENMNDGSVKVIAQGEKQKLEKFIAYLKKGPLLADVKNVEVKWDNCARTFSEFTIVF